MHTSDAIKARRSVKRFTERVVTRDEITTLLDHATLAPNHKLNQPWRFYVLGPEARYAYGLALGARKAKKLEDPAAAAKLRETVAVEHRALPGMLAIAVVNTENAEQREEDYAAAMMAVQNISLTAVALGLGTHIKTGAIMNDPAARAAARVPDDQRIIAIVNVGSPAEELPAKKREPSATFTTWLD
jgi:nitroreductase